MQTTAQVAADLLPRIEAAAKHRRETEDADRLALDARDDLIVRAVDAGISQRKIAEAAGVRVGNITRILAKPGVQ